MKPKHRSFDDLLVAGWIAYFVTLLPLPLWRGIILAGLIGGSWGAIRRWRSKENPPCDT